MHSGTVKFYLELILVRQGKWVQVVRVQGNYLFLVPDNSKVEHLININEAA